MSLPRGWTAGLAASGPPEQDAKQALMRYIT